MCLESWGPRVVSQTFHKPKSKEPINSLQKSLAVFLRVDYQSESMVASASRKELLGVVRGQQDIFRIGKEAVVDRQEIFINSLRTDNSQTTECGQTFLTYAAPQHQRDKLAL